MTGSVRRRITINSSFPDMGVPAYRARKRAAYEERSMRQTVSATGAPAAVGSYSQAVKAGNLLFLSGQLCANPETGRFERESVAAQTRRIMENIKAIIEEAGGTLDAVVHCRAFLSDMKHFPEFESVYRSYFSAPYPAPHNAPAPAYTTALTWKWMPLPICPDDLQKRRCQRSLP